MWHPILGYPVPQQDDMILAWYGKAGSFRHVSYTDLYEDFSREHLLRKPDEFNGKLVIVGTAATGLQDMRVTPMASLYPGMEILTTALDNLKNRRVMQRASAWAPPLLLAWSFYFACALAEPLREQGSRRYRCSAASSIRM